jgi:creatinine amidohydrolase
MTALNAFKEAYERLEIMACFPYAEFMGQPLGLSEKEPFFYTISPQEINVSSAEAADVHAGDIETATINRFYPHLVDTEKAKSLPGVSLGDRFEAWMFGGKLKEISPQGYLGSPASYDSVDIEKNVEDFAQRISDGIIARLNSCA